MFFVLHNVPQNFLSNFWGALHFSSKYAGFLKRFSCVSFLILATFKVSLPENK